MGVCLTWRCEVNGEPGPSGISYNEVNAEGKVCFARDIPAPSLKPPPVATLAKLASPRLRVLTPRAPLPALGETVVETAGVTVEKGEEVRAAPFEPRAACDRKSAV